MQIYRPILILLFVSKITEKKVLNSGISCYLNKYKPLSNKQFRFRHGLSAKIAVTTFIDKIRNHLDTGKFAMGLFLGFSGGFDTINHCVLHRKLEVYGFVAITHSLLRTTMHYALEQRAGTIVCQVKKSILVCLKALFLVRLFFSLALTTYWTRSHIIILFFMLTVLTC